MTTLDTTLRQKAYDTVQLFGKSLIFHNNAGAGGGTYDADTGGHSASSKLTYAYKTSPPSAYVRKFGDTSTDVDGEVEVTLPALNLNAVFESDFLRVGMRVGFDGTEWRAVAIEPFYSGELIAAYRIVLKSHTGK